MYTDQREIYNRFVDARKKHKLTIREVSEFLGVSEKAIYAWLNLSNRIPMAACIALENYDIIVDRMTDKI